MKDPLNLSTGNNQSLNIFALIYLHSVYMRLINVDQNSLNRKKHTARRQLLKSNRTSGIVWITFGLRRKISALVYFSLPWYLQTLYLQSLFTFQVYRSLQRPSRNPGIPSIPGTQTLSHKYRGPEVVTTSNRIQESCI